MKLQVSESVDAEEWDRTLYAFGGPVFHSAIWAAYTRTLRPNLCPQFLRLLSDEGELMGMALGFRCCPRAGISIPFTGKFSLDSSPLVRDGSDDLFSHFIGLLEDYARASGCAELEIGSYASKRGEYDLEARRFGLYKRFEFLFPLDVPEKDLWQRIGYAKRRKIRKALKLGVKVHELPSESGVSHLRRLMAASSQRIMTRGGPDISYFPTQQEDPLHVLLRSNVGRVIGASVNGEVVSAAFFTFFNGLVFYNLAGHSEQGLATQAPTLLLWESIIKYKEEGAIAFNLGGCRSDAVDEDSPEHGLYQFKRTFGADLVECVSASKTFYRPWLKVINVLRGLRGLR